MIHAVNFFIFKGNGARGRSNESCKQLKRGRLSASRFSKKGCNRVWFNIVRDVVYDFLAVVFVADIYHLKNRHQKLLLSLQRIGKRCNKYISYDDIQKRFTYGPESRHRNFGRSTPRIKAIQRCRTRNNHSKNETL